MIYFFMFIFYLCVYTFFEVTFNAISRLLGFYNLQKDENKYTMVGSCSLFVSLMGGLIGLSLFSIFILFSKIPVYFLPLYSVLCGVIITLFELLFGSIFNTWLKFNLWNYKKEPFNFKGNISLFRSIGWCLIGIVVYFLNSWILSLLK